VTGRERRAERSEYLATHDDLTGVANLAVTTRALNHLAALSARQRSEGALLRLRITNIDDLNSIYGFETGDRVLREFANRLSRIIRTPDVLGRIGGADFALILYGATQKDVKAITDRLFFLLENSPIKTPHGGLYGDISIGSTQVGTQANSAQDALTQSRIALSKAKPSALCMYDETMGSDTVNVSRETSSKDILAALNERRIQLAYQPIIHTKTARLHHYECLLRLRREDGEVVSAGQFIMAAERLGLVHLLDRRALELASETLMQEPGIHLALNVSAGTIKDPETASDYVNALKALGPNAEQVTLELTETVALDDPALASEFSNDVRALGCHFAIDDFGSGYTTFRNLMAIEARRLGVDYLQGYLFGVPSAAPSWQKRAS